jgi:hypothetical protein
MCRTVREHLPHGPQGRMVRAVPPAPARTYRRTVIVVVLVLLALGLDAAAGFNLIAAAGCITFFVVQLLAMTAGSVLAVVGLVMWIVSRFKSRRALTLMTVALVLAAASLLLSHFASNIGFVCGD